MKAAIHCSKVADAAANGRLRHVPKDFGIEVQHVPQVADMLGRSFGDDAIRAVHRIQRIDPCKYFTLGRFQGFGPDGMGKQVEGRILGYVIDRDTNALVVRLFRVDDDESRQLKTGCDPFAQGHVGNAAIGQGPHESADGSAKVRYEWWH